MTDGAELVRLRPRAETLYVSQNRTVLATARDGFIHGTTEQGLFVYETRLLSCYRYLIDGKEPQPVALSNVVQHNWLGYYITLPPGIETPPPDEGSGQVKPSSEQTLELKLARQVGEGVHEDVSLTNFSLQSTRFTLALELDADFADITETGSRRQQTGELQRAWRELEEGVWELRFAYSAEHEYDHQGNRGTASIERQLQVRIEKASSPPSYEDGRLAFTVELAPGATWHCCLHLVPVIEGKEMADQYSCYSFGQQQTKMDRRRIQFLEEATGFSSTGSETLTHVVLDTLEQAKRDLVALRLYDLDLDERAWTMAAGLPVYVALFGRDTLTAAWQAGLLGPEMMDGTLQELANWQGTALNAWRDEEPGRMLHEAHTGPLSMLNYNPRRRYYGSVTTSGFYPVIVSELWHWTGDKARIKPLLEPMLKALQWLDVYGDLDGDGFYEYKTRSQQGTKHQAWKDSRDAIVYPDGTQVEPPIATSEEQGFAYAARLQAAELLWWLDEKDEARRQYQKAAELKKRFNEAFWMDDRGFYAMGLDAQNRQIMSIGSNAGHLLATGIVDSDLVQQTADRLFADDLFSGWGIRTLSADHPAYNPYSYHRGSVWPVEQGTFALGFMRYGLFDYAQKISKAQIETAALFDFYRLPEVFSGHVRDDAHPFPAFYPQANAPQAWSASAVFCFVQALLGLYPYAPFQALIVDPHLPAWLPAITLHNLRVGEAAVTLHFYRKEDGASDYEIRDLRGPLRIIRQPSPWSLTTGFGERLRGLVQSGLQAL